MMLHLRAVPKTTLVRPGLPGNENALRLRVLWHRAA